MTDQPLHPEGELNIREQIVRIDQMIADIDRKRQEIRFAPRLAIAQAPRVPN
jgi:hypothetical protein